MAVATTSTKSRVRKGDTVVILSGKDRGKQGKVLQVMPAASKVVVEKLNLFKRHTKPGKANKGGIIEKERALQLAKVMVLCPHCSAPSRLGVTLLENGKRQRQCKSCGEIVDKG